MNSRFCLYARITTIAGITLFLAACQQVSQSIKDTFNTLPEEQATAQTSGNGRIVGFVDDSQALAQAEESLRSLPQYQNTSIYLYGDIHFYDDGRIYAQLQHPEKPEYIDTYSYGNGTWSGPEPVQLSVYDDLESKLVALDSVPFSTVATVARHYNEKAATVAGAGDTNHIYLIIRYGITMWYPQQIDGTRESWHIYFRRDGSIATFKRN